MTSAAAGRYTTHSHWLNHHVMLLHATPLASQLEGNRADHSYLIFPLRLTAKILTISKIIITVHC